MRSAILALAVVLAGTCSTLRADEGRGRVVACSTTQVADFARQVVGDRWEVRCILAPGQDPHLYRIRPADARTVADADLCLENGLHLEGKDWMKTLAHEAGKPVVRCTDGIEPLLLKVPEEPDRTINDPHAWFTPANATVYVKNILAAVSQIDPEHKEEYEQRAELYLAQLRDLHYWIIKQVAALDPDRRVLVTSHDAFNYFCHEYGFQSAAPAGWSTGQEIGAGATPAKRRETVASIRNMGVKAIFVETSVSPKMIRQIASEAGVVVGGKLYSDSMGPAGSGGETYIGMMRENVLTIVGSLK